jgi:hypothetical protein
MVAAANHLGRARDGQRGMAPKVLIPGAMGGKLAIIWLAANTGMVDLPRVRRSLLRARGSGRPGSGVHRQ